MTLNMRKNKQILFYILIIFAIIILKLNLHEDITNNFLETDKCPSCYGLQCESFTTGSVQLSSYTQFKLFNWLFNVKNVYYGRVKETSVVVKKLAHNDELSTYDGKLCDTVQLASSCDVAIAMNKLVRKYNSNISAIIEENKLLFHHSEAIKCKHSRILPYLFAKFNHKRPHDHNVHHFLTLMAVNPEPIIMEAFRDIFPYAVYIGACGRTITEEFAGKPLSSYYENHWSQRASLALQLLRIADAMTNNDIRIYLTDPSSDNFAVDHEGVLRMVDLENVVLVDSKEENLVRSVHFNDGFGCSGCLSYDYNDLCSHSKADHNYFAICKGLLSSKPFSSSLPGGLLHSIPENIRNIIPNLPSLIEECAQPKVYKNRIEPARMLSEALSKCLLS